MSRIFLAIYFLPFITRCKSYHEINSAQLAVEPERFWGCIKSNKNDSSGIALLRGQDGQTYRSKRQGRNTQQAIMFSL